MSPNEVSNVHPEVSNFLSTYAQMSKQHKDDQKKIESQEAIIATLEDQIVSYRELVADLSAKSDYYMRLSVEMRTHFLAMQAITKEAEKCFNGGPYRNNGSVSKETLRIQIAADEVDKQAAITEDEIVEIKERMEQLAVPVETKFENMSREEKEAHINKQQNNDKIPSFLTENGNGKKKGWNK